MIRFVCPACKSQLKAADAKAGQPARCPKCGFLGRIPPPDPLSDTPTSPQPANKPNEPSQPARNCRHDRGHRRTRPHFTPA
ncbi:MAG: hypothetical protein ACJ8F7_20005 [Gemmataceae bacterium]